MAQTENGIGISWKLTDGTMIWVRRDDWAELTEDIRLVKGEDYLTSLEAALKGGGAAPQVVRQAVAPVSVDAPPTLAAVPDETLTPEQVAEQLGGGTVSAEAFQVCPACGALKNKWVKPGVSSRTGKAYKGFYGCPTRGCPGR